MTDEQKPNEEQPSSEGGFLKQLPDMVAESQEATECWLNVYPQIAKGRDLTPPEENALIRYCVLWAEWKQTSDNIAQYGKVIPKKDAEGKVVSYKDRPEVSRQRALATKLSQMEAKLGIDTKTIAAREAEESAQEQQENSGGRYDHLRKYQFKPGQSGNPSGRPKGTVNLTNKLRQLFQMPVRVKGKRANRNYIYADLFCEMAMEASLEGNFKFFKEIFDRVEGKVPDHVVMESAKKMLEVQAATLAQSMLDIVEEVSQEILSDPISDMFIDALGKRFEEKFIENDGEPEGGVDGDATE